MAPRSLWGRCRCSESLSILSSARLLLWWILPASSLGQLTSDGRIPSTSSARPRASNTTSGLSTSPSSLASLLHSNASTTTTLSTIYPSSSAPLPTPDDDVSSARTGLLNYYFLLLALLVVLLVSGTYTLHRRKKRLKARLGRSRRTALARDLDGWATSRRWAHGGRRAGHDGAGREEGLDEFGEPPPPYGAAAAAAAAGPALPLRTLERGARAPAKPPDYREVVREVGAVRSGGPDAGGVPAGAAAEDQVGSPGRALGHAEERR